MSTVTIKIRNRQVRTLKEKLRPGLKAVFVGLNPSRISVQKGHYYQGRLGLRFWKRVEKYLIDETLLEGHQDEIAFRLGYGFADLVRRPTSRAANLAHEEIRNAVPNFIRRIEQHTAGQRKPLIIFVFAAAYRASHECLQNKGYKMAKMPPPYANLQHARLEMRKLQKLLRRQ
jgi:TDG/mug DNA glycosylase family protein